MAYRRTPNVSRKMAARQRAILDAARALASEGGMAAVQIAPVAARAGIAAGTVYRYFPAKSDLVAALVAAHTEAELAVIRDAADAAPGPLSALAAALTTFAARATARRLLSFAILAEPVEPDIDAVRQGFRQALAAELAQRIDAGVSRSLLASVDPQFAAATLIGAAVEGLIGPLAPSAGADLAAVRTAVQTFTLFSLRGLGMLDARARGLVVQTALPLPDDAA